MGKQLRHPATVIAALALFVALGGGAAWASGMIRGSQIRNHSIASKKLTKRAIKSLSGKPGPAGPAGLTGATGPAGLDGAAWADRSNGACWVGGAAWADRSNGACGTRGTHGAARASGNTGHTGRGDGAGGAGGTGRTGWPGRPGGRGRASGAKGHHRRDRGRATGATGAQGPAGSSGSTVGYTATGSAISGFHAVNVTAKAANISIKLTGLALFASATSYVCFGSDVTPKHTGAVVTFTYSSGSQFLYTLSGSRSVATDTVEIVCEGR